VTKLDRRGGGGLEGGSREVALFCAATLHCYGLCIALFGNNKQPGRRPQCLLFSEFFLKLICCSLQDNLVCEGGGGAANAFATATAKVDLVGADLILPFEVLK